MRKKIKTLVIGAGSIGTRHINNLLRFGNCEVAISDSDRRKLRAFGRKLPVFNDHKAALKTWEPKIVLICTPPRSHIELASLALDHNCDIFIEKPLSYSLNGVDKLIGRARKLKRIVMVACNWRYNKGMLALRQAVKNKSFGRVLYAEVKVGYFLPEARKDVNYKRTYAASRLEGGVILDSGSHVLDYLIDLFGDAVDGASIVSNLHPIKIEAEEIAKLILRHKNGVISSVALDYVSQRPVHRLEVVCGKGLLSLDFREERLTFESGAEKKILYRGSGDLNRMFIDEINDFLEKAEKRVRPLQNLSDARKRMEILLKLKGKWQVKTK